MNNNIHWLRDKIKSKNLDGIIISTNDLSSNFCTDTVLSLVILYSIPSIT